MNEKARLVCDPTARLPREIVEGLERKYPDPEAFAAACKMALRIRREAHGAMKPTQCETREEVPQALAATIKELNEGEHEVVGTGKAGKVIASFRKPDVCYKVLFNASHQPPGTNDISLESDLQTSAADLGEYAGVRVPKVLYFVTNEHNDAIAMERLNAVSLKDIFERGAVLPKSFNESKFFDALKRYINHLNDAGIYHRDLHSGNVLVDKMTGMPYVIDFGHATRSIGEDGVYRTNIVTPTGIKPHVFTIQDHAAPARLRQKMREFQAR